MTENILHKKINLISKIILIIFFLILFKIWHLTIIQKEDRLKQATHPQRRTILQKANRGIICDRKDTLLALNKIKYNATVYYSHIRAIPFIKYEKDKNGKKIKKYIRKEYIKNLSSFLEKPLGLKAARIEDLIHAKASILPHVPFVIKENIPENVYYKLKMLQRDWPGLHMEISSERSYPMQKVGSTLLGYMGQISQKEYFKIVNEFKNLQKIIEKYENNEWIKPIDNYDNIDDIKKRLLELKKLAYMSSDLIGKTAIEKTFEESLKGFHEKKTYAVDSKGNFLQEIKGAKKPIAGKKINLSISAELQAFAENLLIEDDKNRKSTFSKKSNGQTKNLWEKGGAIVAMNPNNGEILACASYPRFDPNDFISTNNLLIKQKKQKNINKWLETISYIGNIFDGKSNLTKEISLHKYEEKKLFLETFLDFILPPVSPIKEALKKINTIKNAIELQENVEALLYFSKAKNTLELFDTIFQNHDNEISENLKKALILY